MFTALKQKSTLIEHFGSIYIDFDEYPPYSDAISEFFVTNVIAHIQCDHGYPYSSIHDNMLTYIKKES